MLSGVLVGPEVVRFEGLVWEDVVLAVIDREAAGLVEEWGDEGAFAQMVDVARQRVMVKLTRRVLEPGSGASGGDDLGGAGVNVPELGQLGELTLRVRAGRDFAGGRRVRVQCVCTGVKTSIGAAGDRATPVQTIEFVAVSDGAQEPVRVDVGPVE